MKKKQIIFAIILYFLIISSADEDIKQIISRMDGTDKCGQMTQVTVDVVQNDNFLLIQDPRNITRLKSAIIDYKIGSIQNTPYTTAQKGEIWQKIIKSIHDETLNTNLKIPLLYGIDSIHGANYIQEAILFPQPLNQAATFNTELVESIGEIVAKETRAFEIP